MSSIIISLLYMCILVTAAPCTFIIDVVGTADSVVKQDRIGEFRIGGIYPRGLYYIESGILYDSIGHNCIVDQSSGFYCTLGIANTVKFSINDQGKLLYNGEENWLACPSNDGSHVIHAKQKESPAGCQTISLKTTLRTSDNSCTAFSQPSVKSAPNCPTDLSAGPGKYEFPHLILPTSPRFIDQSFGISYWAFVGPQRTTLFNFDIPASYDGLTCSLIFLLPFGNELDPNTGKFYYSGMEQVKIQHGGLNFALLNSIANAGTTFRTTPGVERDYGKVEIIPGNKYTVATFPCPAGRTVTYKVSSVNNTELDYFQNSAPAAIGLYMVPCSG